MPSPTPPHDDEGSEISSHVQSRKYSRPGSLHPLPGASGRHIARKADGKLPTHVGQGSTVKGEMGVAKFFLVNLCSTAGYA